MTTSIWDITGNQKAYPVLEQDIETEVLVIGGGISGLMAARYLQKRGKEVCLVEARRIGAGVTGHTTSHLTTAVDARYYFIRDRIGEDAARQLAEAAKEAIRLVEETDEEELLESYFRRMTGYLYAEPGQPVDELKKEFEASRDAGLEVEWLDSLEELPFRVAAAVAYPQQATFHAAHFVHNLAEKLHARGVQIYEQSRVSELDEKGDHAVVQLANGHTIRASQVIMATHSPLFIDPVHTLKSPYRSYVVAFSPADGTRLPDRLYWDMDSPYHYTRNVMYQDREIIIVGGADHKTGQHDDEREAFESLKNYVKSHYEVKEFLFEWSAQVYEPADGLPFIGKSLKYDRVYISTGYSGDGTLWGSFGGKLLSDLITGRENRYAKLFSPKRANIKAGAPDFVKENLNVGARFVLDRFDGMSTELEEIPRGEGKIVRQGIEQYAVYRDGSGKLHVHSPICVHMGCVVQWNSAEKTWDCPCHGGRYAPDGAVIEGPPASGLKGKKLD